MELSGREKTRIEQIQHCDEIKAGFSSALWTEILFSLNELKITFKDMELSNDVLEVGRAIGAKIIIEAILEMPTTVNETLADLAIENTENKEEL